MISVGIFHAKTTLYVTQSGKTGFIAYLKVSTLAFRVFRESTILMKLNGRFLANVCARYSEHWYATHNCKEQCIYIAGFGCLLVGDALIITADLLTLTLLMILNIILIFFMGPQKVVPIVRTPPL